MKKPSRKTDLYIGLISGTSMDGIDAALVNCSSGKPVLTGTLGRRYSAELRNRLDVATRLENPRAKNLADLDNDIGREFAEAASSLLAGAGYTPEEITAIGSHGQTIRHEPDAPEPYTLQMGNPQLISELTGIDVVADFRTPDMEAGGQGAPLVPAFHHAVFASDQEFRVVLNIGGIANITVLPDGNASRVTGFDTGPGNTLMDAWARRMLNTPMDDNGEFAAAGTVSKPLLQTLLQDSYFSRPPPKSTGPEYFNLDWLLSRTSSIPLPPQDIQATLCELTAVSVTADIYRYASATARLMVCGGGAHNHHLMQRLAANLPGIPITTTQDFGIDPDWVEAAAFAWLASQRLAGKPGNLPAVTGAREAVLLGRIFTTRKSRKLQFNT
jgi:anhydro-N-acetylmuramic acid kinase